jgi:hypothetical protein
VAPSPEYGTPLMNAVYTGSLAVHLHYHNCGKLVVLLANARNLLDYLEGCDDHTKLSLDTITSIEKNNINKAPSSAIFVSDLCFTFCFPGE